MTDLSQTIMVLDQDPAYYFRSLRDRTTSSIDLSDRGPVLLNCDRQRRPIHSSIDVDRRRPRSNYTRPLSPTSRSFHYLDLIHNAVRKIYDPEHLLQL